MAEIRLEVQNRQVIETLAARLNNSAELMTEKISGVLLDEIFELFDSEGHGSWPALKIRQGKPLQDTRCRCFSFQYMKFLFSI